MPGKIKVKILAGRNLPVMDRSGDTTDAYVEIKFSNTTYKTDVCRKSLNPQWNSEWYRFEVDDAELQDEPLQIRLMDHDTYSANDAIGKVYVNLNPLLLPGVSPPIKNFWTLEASMNSSAGAQGSVMTGWIPVYDTMHGIRGEVNIIVKVELFSDFNKFRQSSCGVQFFYSSNVPQGYHVQVLHGFVEELVVSDDPEYKWIDKIRTPRASNEARQTLFLKLSGEVQRKIGLKALELGGNAVIGYLQNFDLEGEAGIVARGIGTAVTLVKIHEISNIPATNEATNNTLEELALFSLNSNKDHSEIDVLSRSPSNSPVLTPKSYPSGGFADTFASRRQPNFKAFGNNKFRQMSLQSFNSARKPIGSTLSLSDDLLNDESVRSMLALEDVRGEPYGNRFSRGLRNLKSLPQGMFARGVAHIRARLTESIDDESDLDNYSSSWSITTGSDSARSSIVELETRRKKRSMRKKASGEGVASLLIRSMHSGGPILDIVTEDRETPTPSPLTLSNDEEQLVEQLVDSDLTTTISEVSQLEEKAWASKVDLLKVEDAGPVPMISSSETDTSSSDDELASYSMLTNYSLLKGNHDTPGPSVARVRPKLKVQKPHVPSKKFLAAQDSPNTDLTSSDLDSDIVKYTTSISIELPSPSKDKEMELLIPVEAAILKIEQDTKEDVEPDLISLDNVDSTEAIVKQEGVEKIYDSTILVHIENEVIITPEALLVTKEVVKEPIVRLTNVIENPLYMEDLGSTVSTPSIEFEIIKIDAISHDSVVSSSDESAINWLESETERTRRDKSPKRKVERTDTVIYKGPPARLKPNASPTSDSSKLKDLMTVSGKQEAPKSEKLDLRYLQVPTIKVLEINVRNPCVQDANKSDNEHDSPGDHSTSEEYSRDKQSRQCSILDLIKLIDTKMMVHHSRESMKKRRKHDRHNHTPSPDSTRKMSQIRRTKTEKHLHHHTHRHETSSPHASRSHSVKAHTKPPHKGSHHQSAEINSLRTIMEPTDEHLPPEEKSEFVELREIKQEAPPANPGVDNLHVNVVVETRANDDNGQVAVIHVTPDNNTFNITNNDGVLTENLCVPCLPTLPRQEKPPASPAINPPTSVKATVAPPPSSQSPAPKTPLHRRSSDSDLSVTPKGNSLAGSDRSMGGYLRATTAIVRTMNQDALEMLEYPFITMQQYPPGFIVHIGGLVSSRSVKLVEKISNQEEPEGRNAWWTEIRMEVRSHARALACNVVLGYKEEISICDDVCVLNASGTAAVIQLQNTNLDSDGYMGRINQGLMATSIDSKVEKSEENATTGQQQQAVQCSSVKPKRISESNDHELPYHLLQTNCSLCHLPYSEASVPFKVNISKCSICRRARVPDVLFTTMELPENIPVTGRGCFINATICKCKKDLRGELNAKEISDCLPFLEYELHSLLLNKLKVKGMNAIFGLKVQVSIGERLIVGMAVGTAVFLTALPAPSLPKIASGNLWHNEDQLQEIQKSLLETFKKNKEFFQLKQIIDVENGKQPTASDTDESDEDMPDMDLGIGPKDTCVLEVDDVEDMDRISLLIDERPPDDFHVVNTQTIPGLDDLEIVRNLQMFTQVTRAKIPSGQLTTGPSKHLARLLQTVCFKLRRMVPCALCDMQFKVALPEQDEIQLSVVGMALGLGEPLKFSKLKRRVTTHNASRKDRARSKERGQKANPLDDNDMIFNLEEDHTECTPSIAPENTLNPRANLTAQKNRARSPFRPKIRASCKHVPLKERYGVDITPLSYLPGGKIERYLGNLNFFFIRESTSIRENGGLSGFTHTYLTEVMAIVRAHITALGGNAMVAFFMTQCSLVHNPHKNQGQCLINVGGDVVVASYLGNEKQASNANC